MGERGKYLLGVYRVFVKARAVEALRKIRAVILTIVNKLDTSTSVKTVRYMKVMLYS